MALKQQNRLLNLTTVLGDDVLLLTSFSGSEEMGRLFHYQLDMISDDAKIKPQDIVGTAVGWSIELADQSRRHWHGFVSSLSRGDVDLNGRRNYRVEVVPWLWFLTQTSDCKIFQETNVPSIIDAVLSDYGFADYQPDFQLDHKDWEYCVQYRETDFNFLSRLMEHEGIFYYFQHTDGAHKMVITDHKDGYSSLPESTVDFPGDTGGRAIEDHLTSWERRFQFVPGKFAQRDYNFKTPTDDLQTDTGTVVDLPDVADYELYDYPGEYADKGVGSGETRLRIEAEEARHDIVNASSLCKTFQSGGRFSVGQHRDSDEEGAEVVITKIRHSAKEPMAYETGGDNDLAYHNEITCLPSSRVFRPTRSTIKPTISGIQTAVVTGPPGEEIYPDEFGRVKCQFHWDRYGQKDDNSSCWIRVSQVHAGSGFGGIDIPRIDQEVVVSFLEGDPDRPLITGRVYHAQNMPPWELPANKTQSGYLSRSSKDGGKDNANAIRFEDLKGEEQLWIHAEKNQDIEVENDESHWVGRDRKKQVDRNERVGIGKDRTESVGHDENIAIGNDRTENVTRNESISIGQNRDTDVGKNESLSVGENHSQSVGKDETIDVGGNRTETIGKEVQVTIGQSRMQTIGDDDQLQVGKKFALVAADEILLQTGSASILMKKNGDIQIKGKNITISGSGKIGMKASGKMMLKGSKITEN
ncbi:type VI secretion system tip protein VgrG [Stieleria sp. TO1_6]|uniref:type VI secretion system Vgr family protein n=1 Tax=Stieleria tagensis TaxID=2956795 RepID=UPI00209AF753|nr:type VI secretion system tip protein TssI/VgrG [Stieleria tagensis]MCO8121107.1 type VI secretion system tip protein VgrG [Stieleria tagensis]